MTTQPAPRTTRRNRTTAIAIAAVLVASSSIGLGFVSAADAKARTEQAQALELQHKTAEARRLLDVRTAASAALAAEVTTILTADAQLLAAGGDPLERVTLYSSVITTTTAKPIEKSATLRELETAAADLERMSGHIVDDLPALAATATAAAQARLAAAPLADAASQAAVASAGAAVAAIDFTRPHIAEPFAALLASVGTAEASHAAETARIAAEQAAAAAAAQAAADAAARQSAGGRAGGSSKGGGRGGAKGGGGSAGGGGSSSGGGGSAGGGGGSTGGGGGGGGAAAYTNAQAASAVSSRYGGKSPNGDCVKANYGEWGATSSPPPPKYSGSLGFEAGANAAGTGGWVRYYSCP